MVTRPASIPNARETMRVALAFLNEAGEVTPCFDKPARYADSRPTPEEAKELCHGCPLIQQCLALGFTESVYADEMVYGGKVFKRGKPVDSTSKKRQKGPKFR